MMQDPQELANFGLFRAGIDPDKSTLKDWNKAAAVLDKQRNDGLVRAYYDQSYLNAISRGDIWITMAWSGDIFQQNQSTGNNDLQFVVPDEGGNIWTDNMMIPKLRAEPGLRDEDDRLVLPAGDRDDAHREHPVHQLELRGPRADRSRTRSSRRAPTARTRRRCRRWSAARSCSPRRRN